MLGTVAYPSIEALPQDGPRPFWSVMIPTYNRVEHLGKTLQSVLAQNIGPEEMQIEVIDNCSTEAAPENVVREIAPGRVSFYRQPYHLGMSANWTTCVQRARGYWVHILHDDDVLLPGFYQAYRAFISRQPDIVALFCRAISTDANDQWLEILYSPPGQQSTGVVVDGLPKLVATNFIVTSTVVVRRSAYEELGGFHPVLPYTPDWEMWLRLASYGTLGYVHHPYLLRRIHPRMDTDRFALSGENLKEIMKTVEMGLQRLPSGSQRITRRAAYRNYSRYASQWRSRFHSSGLHQAALRHAFWAFRLHPSVKNCLCLGKSLWLSLVAREQGGARQ